MWKYVSLEHLQNVFGEYPSSNSNKILNAIEEDFVYDEYDIRSQYTIFKTILILAWVTILLYLQAKYNIFSI
jgi:hypothetical protein